MAVRRNWVRTSDLESDVTAQLKQLRECNETLYHSPYLLRDLPAHEVLTYFGRCWRGSWRHFVANAMPYVCVRAWMATGFQHHQFMLVRQGRLREATADKLLPALANFTGLHYNQPVLADKSEELNVHCEAPRRPKPPTSQPRAAANAAPAATRGGARRRARAREDDPVHTRPLVNTHADYTGNDAVRRTQLGGETLAELTRLATAHTSLLDGLRLQELA